MLITRTNQNSKRKFCKNSELEESPRNGEFRTRLARSLYLLLFSTMPRLRQAIFIVGRAMERFPLKKLPRQEEVPRHLRQ